MQNVLGLREQEASWKALSAVRRTPNMTPSRRQKAEVGPVSLGQQPVKSRKSWLAQSERRGAGGMQAINLP